MASHGVAVLAGVGINSDGHKTEGITYPSADTQAHLMKTVFAASGVNPAEVRG